MKNFDNFDSFLDTYYEELRKLIKSTKDKQVDYNDIIEKVKENIRNKQQNNIKKKEVKSSTNENINNKIKTMNVGQSNLKEATKFSQYYKYSVTVQEHRQSDKNNYVFKLDNNFFKKLFKKTEDRFIYHYERAKFYTVVFKYKPNKTKLMVNDMIISLSPFEIALSTDDCQDFLFYHTPNDGDNCEKIKAVYRVNIKKALDKLRKIIDDTEISDKGKNNMIVSLQKHLSNLQGNIGVDDYEEFFGLTEDNALIIVDDYEDKELFDSLKEYLI